MYTRFTILPILLCIICLTLSCKKSPETVLSEFDLVESVMWNHPDSALSLLEKMPTLEFSNKLNHATWCLLYTQAWDKNYNKHTSDSLINIAVEYFDAREDWKKKAQAWFYKGQVLRDLQKEDEATTCYVKAKDMLVYFEDPLFASLVCQTLGNLYRYQRLYHLSLDVLRDGVKYASMIPEGDDLSYAFSELGRTFAECAEMDSAQYYFECSLENARSVKSLDAESMAIGELGVVFRSIGKYDEALKYKKEELIIESQQNNIRNIPQIKHGMGVLFYYMGELDSAKVYLEAALATSNIYTIRSTYNVLYQISQQQDKYKDAVFYNEQFRIYNDSIVNVDKTRAIAEIQIKYDNEKLDNERKNLLLRNDRLQKISLGVGLILVFLIGLIAFIYQRTLWLKERHIRKAQEEIQVYSAKLFENEQAIRDNQELIKSFSNELGKKEGLEGLVNEQSIQISQLQNQIMYLQSENLVFQEKIKKAMSSLKEYEKWRNAAKELTLLKNRESFLIDYIYKHVDVFVNLRKDFREVDNWTLLFESMDILHNRFCQRLKEEFKLLTEDDIQVCCMIKVGLTTSQIAIINGISPGSITKKKSRIRDRINQRQDNLLNANMSLDMFIKKY